jgi:hypothetical protein
MATNSKVSLLRRILAGKVVLSLFVWGLPALLAPMTLFQRLGVPTPDDPLFIRLFGAAVTAIGVAYWYAYKDPIRNVAILKAGIIDNGLVTLVILVFTVFYDLRSAFVWASGVLTFLVFVSFIVLMPKAEAS